MKGLTQVYCAWTLVPRQSDSTPKVAFPQLQGFTVTLTPPIQTREKGRVRVCDRVQGMRAVKRGRRERGGERIDGEREKGRDEREEGG